MQHAEGQQAKPGGMQCVRQLQSKLGAVQNANVLAVLAACSAKAGHPCHRVCSSLQNMLAQERPVQCTELAAAA
jgi:hypothetical protein